MHAFTIAHPEGVSLTCMEYGASITALHVPDKFGRVADVVLGYDQLGDYLMGSAYHGAVIGRFANRISCGRFQVGGEVFQVDCNEGLNHLHGGRGGFHQRVWQGKVVGENCVEFKLRSHAGDQGYPGQLDVRLRYTLLTPWAIEVHMSASSDRTTPINLTQHSYFNLAGHDSGSVDDHTVQVFSDGFVPVDATLLPLGGIEPVEGTPFDLREPQRLGDVLTADHPQIQLVGGLDHSWPTMGLELDSAAVLMDPESGRALTLCTSQPGLHIYTGNALSADLPGKYDASYADHAGVCLEAQNLPNAPNIRGFPTALLNPGEVYNRYIRWEFSCS